MKFDRKGIRFNTWLYFLGLSVSILMLLGFLLVVFIKPYYRQNRIDTIDTLTSEIESSLLYKEATRKDIEETGKKLIGNNVCAIIYNESGKELYYSDALGEVCMLDEDVTIGEETFTIEKEPKKIISVLKEQHILSVSEDSLISDKEMLLYGKEIRSRLVNYYLIINTPLEPVESYVDFILNQYLYMAVVVIGIALILAFILAQRIASPIIRMKKEANKLAEGNYDLEFKTDSYSEINDLATTLDDATDKLSKIDELRKDLVANVSHDIKTPLTMIKAYAEMIRDISGEDPAKREEHLGVIIREVDYLDKLVSDMAELSKFQSGTMELTMSNFDLSDSVREVVELLHNLAEEKKITISTELVPVVVYADEIKISQVLYNFLSNAIKYTDEGGNVLIRMSDSEETLTVEVIDNGDGISEEALPYIWDRYYKIDKRFRRNVNQTGLGLAIAKAILEAHGYEYGVRSKEKEGSTFWFTLTKDYEEI
ncbi:MAG: HAMP domain-containing histidine kinase [Erysipelotrichaceae bacterium]|nr:HAMP domain-containing histidine kinase [Erysipelotrichaceae bacterium]